MPTQGGLMPESNTRTALTEAVYYILLALNTPLHGYGIMQLVTELSHNRVNLGSGTLYGAINTLQKKGWIQLYSEVKTKGKKEYLITPLGTQVVQSEIERLKELYLCGVNITGGDFDAS